ncbi:MAG: peptidoglycan DD-metalloendopeptidase family protein [Candidatus Wenzhouxiangella sp. M2_3B_020]
MHRFMKGKRLVVIAASLFIGACGSDPQESGSDARWPSGYRTPIPGTTFPLAAEYLPGAEREPLAGRHRGFDFLNGHVSRPLPADTAVVSVAEGVVLRADHTYAELDDEEKSFLADRAAQDGPVDEQALDRLLGRQVWIEHEGGYVSRYGHLSSVEESLRIGQPVEAGAVLGRIGTSGIPTTGTETEAEPYLHFELLDSAGRSLGDRLSPLQIHAAVGRIFGDQALPRHAREAVAATRDGEAVPADYPPDPIPDTGFSLDVPGQMRGGSARAVAVRWEDDDFTPNAFFADLNGLGLGFVDAGNGAWLLLPAPPVAQRVEATLTVGGADRYGQSLIGQRSIQILPLEQTTPLEVGTQVYERYASGNHEQETRYLAEAAAASLAIREPLWKQPFQPPAEGQVVRAFGQEIVSGVLRPGFPNPGIDLRTEDESAVLASNAGRVAFVEELPLRGRTVALIHGGGLVSVYAGLDQVAVEIGQQVEGGQVLGGVGEAGGEGRFRWEMHLAGIPVEPRSWLNRILPPNGQ